MNFKYVFSICCGLFFFSLSIFPQTYLEREVLELKENDPFFLNPDDMLINNGNLYLIYNFRHKALKYSLKKGVTFDKYIGTGKKGNGPGDLFLPIGISIFDDTIAIRDNNGFSFFDQTGKFLSRFKIFSPCISFVYADNNIYYATAQPRSPHLIEVFDRQGKLLFSFGKKFLNIDFKKYKNIMNISEMLFYGGKLVADANNIYYFSYFFGKVFKYSLKGELIFEKDISSLFGEKGKEKLQKNSRSLNKGVEISGNNQRITPKASSLFCDVCCCGDKIYILTLDAYGDKKLRMLIKVFSTKNLDFEKDYAIKLNKEEVIFEFAVNEINKKPIFYAVLDTEDDYKLMRFMEK